MRIVFQFTPDAEAPAEMMFHFPELRALCVAENCTSVMHNVYTLRGAQVRDALAWSKYINEALRLFGDDTDIAFASHNWPRFGRDEVRHYLCTQRDTYRYLHDQTMRLANKGLTATEIAEEVELPPSLASSAIAATTAPSATTARPSTSATSAGSTATPPTCTRCRPSGRGPVRRVHGRGRCRCRAGGTGSRGG